MLGTSLKVIKDLGLLEKWQQSGGKSSSSVELAKMVQCDEPLLGTLLENTVQILTSWYATDLVEISQ